MATGEGTHFGKFFLLKRLAIGGMGEIFLAKLKGPEGFEKVLAIKRMLMHHEDDPHFGDMFFAEARVAAKLNHSNIAHIFEMDQVDGTYYISMEYVHGKSLKHVLNRLAKMGYSFHPAHIANIMAQFCDGLGYAHRAVDLHGNPLKIIHRDINPHNVLVSYTGEVKIIDFGIAKSEISEHQTATGTIKGKFVYMSPEQSSAKPLDHRSDIFSLGICLYEALTGTNPFQRDNIVLSLQAIQQQPVPLLADHIPSLAVFDPIIQKCLNKNPKERYPSCEALAHDLRSLLYQDKVPAAPTPLQEVMQQLFANEILETQQIITETSTNLSPEETAQLTLTASGSDFSISEQDNQAASAVTILRLQDDESENPTVMATGPAAPPSSEAATRMHATPNPKRGRVAFLMVAALVLGGAIAIFTAPPEPSRTLPTHAREKLSPTVAEKPIKAAPSTSPAEEPSAVPSTSSGPSKELPLSRVPQSSKKESRKTTKRDLSSSARTAPPSKPKAKTVLKKKSHGNLMISTNPPVAIRVSGKKVGQNIQLSKAQSSITLSQTVPGQTRQMTIRYNIEDSQINYTVHATPFAILQEADGMGLGKTPQNMTVPITAKQGKTTFEFRYPNPGKLSDRVRVTLRYQRP